jgi:hypothetical protein
MGGLLDRDIREPPAEIGDEMLPLIRGIDGDAVGGGSPKL